MAAVVLWAEAVTGYIVVDLDNDTLRDRLAEALDAWRGIDPAHVDEAEVLLGVLRDVGTPATTEQRHSPGWETRPSVTRLVTDWTDETEQPT